MYLVKMWRRVCKQLALAGFADNFEAWHMSKHDIYGELFKQAWTNTAPREVNPADLEAIEQDDDIDVIECDIHVSDLELGLSGDDESDK